MKKNVLKRMLSDKSFPLLLGLCILIAMAVGVYGMMFVHDNFIKNNNILSDDVFYIVSSTEYIYGNDGQVVVRFVTAQDVPVDVDNCTVDIVFPNQTYFIDDGVLSPALVPGDHYYDFVVPETEGIYDYSVTCNWGNGKSRSSSKTFHVRTDTVEVAGEIIVNDTNLSADINELKFSGGTEYVFGQVANLVVHMFKSGAPIDNEPTEIKVFYPNMTMWLNWTNMTFLENGIYHYAVVVPEIEGVYTASARTYTGKYYYASHTFHVSSSDAFIANETLRAEMVK